MKLTGIRERLELYGFFIVVVGGILGAGIYFAMERAGESEDQAQESRAILEEAITGLANKYESDQRVESVLDTEKAKTLELIRGKVESQEGLLDALAFSAEHGTAAGIERMELRLQAVQMQIEGVQQGQGVAVGAILDSLGAIEKELDEIRRLSSVDTFTRIDTLIIEKRKKILGLF